MDEWIKQRIWFTTRMTKTTRYSPLRRRKSYPADEGWDDLFAREAKQMEQEQQRDDVSA